MFDRVVIATDGSRSVKRAVAAGTDLADRFDAEVYALYVVDTDEVAGAPESVRADLETALEESAEAALEEVATAADTTVQTAIRRGSPPSEITRFVQDVEADMVVTGTRGRHGEGEMLLGSVAERVVRICSVPVLTVRQLQDPA